MGVLLFSMEEKNVFKTYHAELIRSMQPEFDLAAGAARYLSVEVPVNSEAERRAENQILHSFVHQVLAVKFSLQMGRDKEDVLRICDNVIEYMENQIADAANSVTVDFTKYVNGLNLMKSKIEKYDFYLDMQVPSNT